MEGSSVNSKGNSSSHHLANKPNEHISDRCTQTPANESGFFDKEMIRLTILAQEATFRKQVYELHRLYKIQKDLMSLLRPREELNGQSGVANSSDIPPGDAIKVGQVGLSSGQDSEQSDRNSMKGKGLEHSLNGVPLTHNNNRLDHQLSAMAYGDDDVEIQEENLAKMPRTCNSVPGRKVKFGLGGSSHMKNSLIAQPSRGPRVNVLNKQVRESSNIMKTTNFPYVGASTGYSSAGVNMNPLSLQDNSKEKGIGESSDSKFFGEGKEMKHKNSYIYQTEDPSNMPWFEHKQNGVDFSTGCSMNSISACNPQILGAPSSISASPWQSSSTGHVDIETLFAQNGLSMDSVYTPPFPKHFHQYHSSNVHEEAQHQDHSTSHDCLKDINLNDDLRTTPEQESDNTPMDILWVKKRLLSMNKLQMPSSCANGHSGGSTSVLALPISITTEKDSRCSSHLHNGSNSTSLIKGDANMEMQSQNKKDETNVKNLFDLNVALPSMDDQEIDVHQSESGNAAQAPDDSTNESLNKDAAK